MKNININGVDYPVLADWATIESFCIKKGIDLSGWPDFVQNCTDISEGKMTQRYADMVLFIMCCLERGSEEKEESLKIKRNTVYQWFMSGNQIVIIDLLKEANGNVEGQSKNPEAPVKGQS